MCAFYVLATYVPIGVDTLGMDQLQGIDLTLNLLLGLLLALLMVYMDHEGLSHGEHWSISSSC